MEYCQRPFRFCHFSRTICGRGYSASARSGVTSFAQRVLSGPRAGCQSAASAVRVVAIMMAMRQSGRVMVGRAIGVDEAERGKTASLVASGGQFQPSVYQAIATVGGHDL